MPVIVVGADTPVGSKIVAALLEPGREVRAFVSDPDIAAQLRQRGVKVALGDVSDPSHIEGCCLNCFSTVFVTEAAGDDRERAFATDVADVLAGWADAAHSAGVERVLWVAPDENVPAVEGVETAIIRHGSPDEVARLVVEYDDARDLSRLLREPRRDVRP